MITDTTRALLGIPGSFVDDIGGVTLASWWPAIEMAIDGLTAPVVEIGADRGFTTKALAAKCAYMGVSFTSVDPNPAPYVDKIETVDHRRVTSEAFFADAATVPPAGVWIVDGDHNYATVLMELRSIADATQDRDAVVFLHDIGWPWGRRDLWYNGSNAPEGAQAGASVSLDNEGVVPPSEGIFMGAVEAVAPREGGSGNGVMTAVEDFLSSPQGADWVLAWSPVFYGFGFVTRRSTLLSGKISKLKALFDSLEHARDILGPLEFNRLRLLQTTNIKWSESAGKDERIAALEGRIAEFEQSDRALKTAVREFTEMKRASLLRRAKAAFSLLKGN
ncbi:class I SAM-dependent methyltransferase [Agrobacterium rubi]|nr:class I SAM-dependent methyltransferase [Agrobacterium rubi]NTF24672.1 class I SAM-dependent methyltransferase [Agrobacterium rubi]